MNKKIIICDLDNCVSDNSWRERCLPYNWAKNQNEDDFDAYNANAKFDRPCNLWILEKYKPTDFDYAFFTSRPEKFRERTLAWLIVHIGFLPTWLFMRPKKFNIDEVRLKMAWARQFAENFGKEKIVKIFDDNQKVCDSYAKIFGKEKVQCVFADADSVECRRPPHFLLKNCCGEAADIGNDLPF